MAIFQIFFPQKSKEKMKCQLAELMIIRGNKNLAIQYIGHCFNAENFVN